MVGFAIALPTLHNTLIFYLDEDQSCIRIVRHSYTLKSKILIQTVSGWAILERSSDTHLFESDGGFPDRTTHPHNTQLSVIYPYLDEDQSTVIQSNLKLSKNIGMSLYHILRFTMMSKIY